MMLSDNNDTHGPVFLLDGTRRLNLQELLIDLHFDAIHLDHDSTDVIKIDILTSIIFRRKNFSPSVYIFFADRLFLSGSILDFTKNTSSPDARIKIQTKVSEKTITLIRRYLDLSAHEEARLAQIESLGANTVDITNIAQKEEVIEKLSMLNYATLNKKIENRRATNIQNRRRRNLNELKSIKK